MNLQMNGWMTHWIEGWMNGSILTLYRLRKQFIVRTEEEEDF